MTPGIRPGRPGRQGRPGANVDTRRGRRRGGDLPRDRPPDYGRRGPSCRRGSHRRGDAVSRRPGTSRKEKAGPPEGVGLFGLCEPPIELLGGEEEVSAAVLLPAGLVGLGAGGRFLALRHDVDAIAGDAQTDQIGLHGVGAALPEPEVVLRGATLVAVSLDVDAGAGPAFQVVGILREDRPCIVTDGRRIEIEEDIAERPFRVQLIERLLRKDLLLGQRRRRWRRWGWRWRGRWWRWSRSGWWRRRWGRRDLGRLLAAGEPR